MVGGPPILFTRKGVVGETHIRKSTHVGKSIVAVDASQLYPYSKCQLFSTRIYTRYDFHADLQRIKPHQNISTSFENLVKSYFQRTRSDCRIDSFYTTRIQDKIDFCNADGF